MEKEVSDAIASNAWNEIFGCIRRDSQNNDFTTLEASRPENRTLNRYRDVYPYDHSRVTLNGQVDTDYINASLVKVPRASRQYILAQGPLPSTVGHFWLTVWQQKSKAVIMLNRVIEKGQLKCHQYWPVNTGDQLLFNDVQLKLQNIHSVPGEHYTVRTLKLTDTSVGGSGESRELLQFHYTTWPDFGVPQCPDTFLEFLSAVRNSGCLDIGPDVGPALVHCSAGIGRSGTFVLVDTCLVLLSKEGPSSLRIREVLLELRNYRMGLIQTPDQLKFSYLAIAEGARQDGLINAERLSHQLDASRQQAAQALAAAVSNSDGDDSDDDEQDDGPPPLPPPRTESLKAATFSAADVSSTLTTSRPMNNGVGGGGGGNADNKDALTDRLNEAEVGPEERKATVNGNGAEVSDSSGSDSESNFPELNSASNSATASSKTDLTTPEAAAAAAAAASSSTAPSTSSSDESGAAGTATTKCILNNHKMEERKREMELRRRKKEEANHAMQSRLQEMKRKAQEAEVWRQRRRWFGRGGGVGGGIGPGAAIVACLLLGAGGVASYLYFAGGGIEDGRT